jgi:hypothetical protein
MTHLTKPVCRESPAWVRDRSKVRPLIVALTVSGVVLRAKGTRKRFTVPFEQLWAIGARNAAEELRAQRKARRAARTPRTTHTRST